MTTSETNYMNAKFKINITGAEENIPIKKLVKQTWGFSSRLMTKLKKQQLIFLNGKSVLGWHTAKAGDIVSIRLPKEKSHFQPEDIPIETVYEDDDLIIVNKQPGVTVHPTKGHPSGTIANGLMKYMKENDESFKIRFVNRLDMDTSGLLIVSKNSYSQDFIVKEMNKNRVEKKYLAVVKGIVPNEIRIDLPIGQSSDDSPRRAVLTDGTGYDSITICRPIATSRSHDTSLVELELKTGRTHQIRVHMSHLGHPLLGDSLYEGPQDIFPYRQALHAYSLRFRHPFTKEILNLQAPLPSDIKELLEKTELNQKKPTVK